MKIKVTEQTYDNAKNSNQDNISLEHGNLVEYDIHEDMINGDHRQLPTMTRRIPKYLLVF